MAACCTAPRPSTIPEGPGSTCSATPRATPLYVGKARSLRARLANYFADPMTLAGAHRPARGVGRLDVDWTVTASEVDALLLENSLIKTVPAPLQHPAEGRQELPLPRGRPARGVAAAASSCAAAVVGACATSARSGTRSPSAATIDLLLPTFPVRTCSDAKFVRHQRLGRPCLLSDLGRCAAPCVGWVDHPTYDEHVQGILRFFSATPARSPATSRRGCGGVGRPGLRDGGSAPRRARACRARLGQPAGPALGPRRPRRGGHRDRRLQAGVVRLVVRKGRVVGRESLSADLVGRPRRARARRAIPRRPLRTPTTRRLARSSSSPAARTSSGSRRG